MKSAVVTGAAGMLGQAICAELAGRGLDVVAAARADLDVTDAGACREFFESRRPDVIFHCAAWTNVDGAESKPDVATRVNHGGTANVVAAADAVGARVVHFSTDYVFDGSATSPLPIDTPRNPISAYGRGKAEAEQAVEESPGRHLIIRTSWLYGPGGGNFIDAMVARAAGGKLNVVNDQVGRPTRTADLAAAAVDLVELGATGVFHVANQGEATWFELAQTIFDWMGSPVTLEPVSTEAWGAPAPRPRYSVLDLSVAEELLGRSMPHWTDALSAHLQQTGVSFTRSG